MAEELDEYGVPIRRKDPVDNGRDEFGVPIKKKVLTQPSSTGSRTGGISSVGGLVDDPPVIPNPLLNRQPSSFNFAEQSNPELVAEVEARNQRQSQKLAKINQVYDVSQGKNATAQARASSVTPTINTGTPEYADRTGNRAKYVYNKFLNGIGEVASAVGDIGATVMANSPNVGYSYNADYQPTRSEEERKEQKEILTNYRKETAGQIRDFLKNNIGADVDKGLEAKYDNEFLTASIGGLANSVPAMLAPAPIRGATFVLQGYDAGLRSIEANDPNGELDDLTKTIYATGVGTVNGLLEKYGFEKLIGNGTAVVAKNLTDKAIKEAVEETGGKVTGDVLTRFLNSNVKEFAEQYSRRGANALEGFAIEFGTGGSQEIANIASEYLLNSATGKPIFDVEDATLEGLVNNIERVAYAGAQEGIGGGIVRGILNPKTVKSLETKKENLDNISDELENPNLSEASKEILVKRKIGLQDEIDTETAQAEEAFNKLNDTQKAQAVELDAQYNTLQEAINDPELLDETVKKDLEKQADDVVQQIAEIKPIEAISDDTVTLKYNRETDIPTELKDRAVRSIRNGLPFFEVALTEAESKNYAEIPVEDIFSHKQTRANQQNTLKANELIKLDRSNEGVVPEITEETISLSDIIPTQATVKNNNLSSVSTVQESKEAPVVLKEDGKYYLLDGHHRIANAINNGDSEVKIKVVDLSKSNEVAQPTQETVVEETISPAETTTTETVQETVEKPLSEKTEQEIEAEIESLRSNYGTGDQRRSLEAEITRRDRESVLGTTAYSGMKALDALSKKQPLRIRQKDAQETREVFKKYLKPANLTQQAVEKDFKDSLLNLGKTVISEKISYANEAKLRQSTKELIKRGIKPDAISEMGRNEFKKFNYTEKETTEKINRILNPLIKEGTNNASKITSTTTVGEQPIRTQGTRRRRSEGVESSNEGQETAGTQTGTEEVSVNAQEEVGNIASKPVSDLTPDEVANEIKRIKDLLKDEGLDKILTNEFKTKVTPKTQEYLSRVTPILSELFPDINVRLYDKTADYVATEGRSNMSAGVYDRENNTIGLNLELIERYGAYSTVFHEAIHPIVDAVYSDKKGALNQAMSKINSLENLEGMDAVFEHVDSYRNLDGETQQIEAITEFLSLVADNRIDVSSLPKNTFTRLKEVVNDIFKALGIQYRIETASDVVKLASSIKKAVETKSATPISESMGNVEVSRGKGQFDMLLSDKEALRRRLKELEDRAKAEAEQAKVDEEKKATALRNRDIAKKRNELGLEDRESVGVLRNSELVEKANARVKEGYDTESLIDDILDNTKEATAEEVVILKEYQLAKEQELIEIGDKIVQATEEGKGTPLDRLVEQRDMIIQDIERAYQAGEKTGTVSARALQARKIALLNDFSLANMLIQRRQAAGGVKLTEEQINETTSEYNKIRKLNEEFQRKINQLESENTDLRAKGAMKGLKSVIDYEQRKAGRVQQRESIDKDIADALEGLSKKVKTLSNRVSANPIPVELIPDLAKLAKLYAKKGINTMEGIVDAMYVKLKGDIEGLQKSDLENVLINYDYEAEAREESRLKAFKKRTEAKTNELRERVQKSDFSKRTFKPLELDAEAQGLQDALRKARYDWEYSLEVEALKRRTRLEKARDITTEILNTPRALMASVDYSAPLRQGLVLGVGNPVQAGRAFVEMFRQSWSQQRFDRWADNLRESPGYAVMKQAGLYIADANKPNLAAKEEAFMTNLAEKIPFLGKAIKIPFTDQKIGGLIKGSERAYVGYLNKLRTDVFSKVATEFENDGKTIENSPKLYEALATYINSATGRGDLGKLENSAQILNSAFFSPRLIASRIRLLIPTWLFGAPKEVRMMYMKDMTRLIGVGTTILGLAALAGADVERDPRSSDFGKIRVGDTRWDIWGGFQQFVRFFTQVATAQRKNTRDKMIREIDGAGFKGETRADLVINMIRSKMAPVPALTWNLAAGKNMVGEEFGLKDVPKSFVPLFAGDLVEAVSEEGGMALLTTGVGAFGVGVQTYGATDKPLTKEEMRKKIKEALDKLKKDREKNN